MFFATRGLRLLLAALLVFSQQQAVLHLLGHDLAQFSQKKHSTDPQELVCAKCLAVAHLDHAVGTDVPVIVPVRAAFDAIDAAALPSLDLAFAADYRSRAPPVLS